jgi:hypothetical protein
MDQFNFQFLFSMEEYYRRSIYIPLLDALVLDINTRYSKENLQCLQIYSFLPENIIKLTHKGVVETVSSISKVYGAILWLSIEHVPALEFTSEVELWQGKWLRMNEEGGGKSLPTDLSVVFDLCDHVPFLSPHWGDKNLWTQIFFLDMSHTELAVELI